MKRCGDPKQQWEVSDRKVGILKLVRAELLIHKKSRVRDFKKTMAQNSLHIIEEEQERLQSISRTSSTNSRFSARYRIQTFGNFLFRRIVNESSPNLIFLASYRLKSNSLYEKVN